MLRVIVTLSTILSAFAATTIDSADESVSWVCPGSPHEVTIQVNSCSNADRAGVGLSGSATTIYYPNSPVDYTSMYFGPTEGGKLDCYFDANPGNKESVVSDCKYFAGGGNPETLDTENSKPPDECPLGFLTPSGGFTRRNLKPRDTVFVETTSFCPQITTIGTESNDYLFQESAIKGYVSYGSDKLATQLCVFSNGPGETDNVGCFYTYEGQLSKALDGTGMATDILSTICPQTLCDSTPKRKRMDSIIAGRQFKPVKVEKDVVPGSVAAAAKARAVVEKKSEKGSKDVYEWAYDPAKVI